MVCKTRNENLKLDTNGKTPYFKKGKMVIFYGLNWNFFKIWGQSGISKSTKVRNFLLLGSNWKFKNLEEIFGNSKIMGEEIRILEKKPLSRIGHVAQSRDSISPSHLLSLFSPIPFSVAFFPLAKTLVTLPLSLHSPVIVVLNCQIVAVGDNRPRVGSHGGTVAKHHSSATPTAGSRS